MKRFYFFLLLSSSLFFGCKNNKEKLSYDGIKIRKDGIEFENFFLPLRRVEVGRAKLSFKTILTAGFQKIEEEDLETKTYNFSDFNFSLEDKKIVASFGDNSISIYRDIGLKIVVETNLKKDGDILPKIKLIFDCQKGERFLGFGSWADGADATGKVREMWVKENHIGDDLKPFGEIQTYFPSPFFVSTKNYAFLYIGFSRSVFTLCLDKSWSVSVFSSSAEFEIFSWYGDPKTAIEKYTLRTGRSPLPPFWTFGVWIDAIFGEEEVLKTAKFLREQKIPSSAIWTEDWTGGNWIGDAYLIGGWGKNPSQDYKNIRNLSDELEKLGFKFLGYFNTFLVRGEEEYDEAVKKGFVVLKRDGSVPHFWVPEGTATLLDITNKNAEEWIKGIMESSKKFFSGWMADFGEYVTPDMVLQGGDGWEVHNLYPYLWAKINFDILCGGGIACDFVFFSRSGYLSQSFSVAIWGGDQNTTFERFDGLGSIIPLATSISFLGVSVWGSDIAGYTSIPKPSDEELYLRWTSLSAFTPLMRTHHGSAPLRNWRFSSSERSLQVFKKFAQIHMKLAPYFYHLAKVGSTLGHPSIRHIFLEYPNEKIFGLEDDLQNQEFFLGEGILVAPIVRGGENRRLVFFPPGEYYDYFTGKKIDFDIDLGFGYLKEVYLPLGEIFVAVRDGFCIPEFSSIPQTLVSDLSDYEIIFRCFGKPKKNMTFYLPTGEKVDVFPCEEKFCSFPPYKIHNL